MKSKFLVLGLIFAIVIVASDTTYAQLSKKETKEWKKKKKSMSVDAFKSMVEENSTLKGQLSNLNKQVETMESTLSDKDREASQLENKVRRLESDLTAAKKELADKPAGPATVESEDGGRIIAGVVFKVQIGAFRNKDLSKYFENNKNFTGEEDDGVQKYTLGQFTDYWEADTFKKYLREMGVKDAWIVSYKDGVRVPLKDVLEGVI